MTYNIIKKKRKEKSALLQVSVLFSTTKCVECLLPVGSPYKQLSHWFIPACLNQTHVLNIGCDVGIVNSKIELKLWLFLKPSLGFKIITDMANNCRQFSIIAKGHLCHLVCYLFCGNEDVPVVLQKCKTTRCCTTE